MAGHSLYFLNRGRSPRFKEVLALRRQFDAIAWKCFGWGYIVETYYEYEDEADSSRPLLGLGKFSDCVVKLYLSPNSAVRLAIPPAARIRGGADELREVVENGLRKYAIKRLGRRRNRSRPMKELVARLNSQNLIVAAFIALGMPKNKARGLFKGDASEK